MSKTKHNHLVKGKNGNIKLVLTEDVTHLGHQGDVVEVRPGYANNFLVPRGLATVPTEHNLKLLEIYKFKQEKRKLARIADLKALADQINRFSGITIESRVTADNTLYGSVGAAEIAKALKDKGMVIETDMVKLEGPIKETGLFAVKLNLGHEIDCELKVMVVPSVEKGMGTDRR
ncbi:MAG: 50S ribosomal protein L9 [Gemmataceae bacterium]